MLNRNHKIPNMKKLIIFTICVLICTTAYSNCKHHENGVGEISKEQPKESLQEQVPPEVMKAVEDMIYDVAHQKIEKFNWLTVQEIPQLFHPKSEYNKKMQMWNEFYSNLNTEMLPLIKESYEKGKSLGIDWNDVTITDVRYKSKYDEQWGAEEIKGYIFLKSNGKPYRIFFKRGFALNGQWRTMLLRFMDQTDEIPSDYPKSGEN